MASRQEAASLRRELAQREKGRGKRYPEQLKARVLAHADELHGSGMSQRCIADELGLTSETLRRWRVAEGRRASRASSALVPVEVVATTTHGRIAVVSPSGFRLEGLELSEAVVILRALT